MSTKFVVLLPSFNVIKKLNVFKIYWKIPGLLLNLKGIPKGKTINIKEALKDCWKYQTIKVFRIVYGNLF